MTENYDPFKVQVGGNHYAKYAIQPLEFIVQNKISFLEGNVIKYVVRWKDKAGLQDLEKARHYLDMLIDIEKRKQLELENKMKLEQEQYKIDFLMELQKSKANQDTKYQYDIAYSQVGNWVQGPEQDYKDVK